MCPPCASFLLQEFGLVLVFPSPTVSTHLTTILVILCGSRQSSLGAGHRDEAIGSVWPPNGFSGTVCRRNPPAVCCFCQGHSLRSQPAKNAYGPFTFEYEPMRGGWTRGEMDTWAGALLRLLSRNTIWLWQHTGEGERKRATARKPIFFDDDDDDDDNKTRFFHRRAQELISYHGLTWKTKFCPANFNRRSNNNPSVRQQCQQCQKPSFVDG
jgi:hypothetical protein